jgi:hypothetical protein
MGFWAIVKLLLQYGPSLVALVIQIWKLISEATDTKDVERETLRHRLREAIDHFRKTRDKGPLEKLRDELK